MTGGAFLAIVLVAGLSIRYWKATLLIGFVSLVVLVAVGLNTIRAGMTTGAETPSTSSIAPDQQPEGSPGPR